MKRFSDFAKGQSILDGDKIKIKEILDEEIEVLSYQIIDSKYKDKEKCLKLQFKINDEKRILFTGSSVLIKQCQENEAEFPFISTIKQIDKYYTFT